MLNGRSSRKLIGTILAGRWFACRGRARGASGGPHLVSVASCHEIQAGTCSFGTNPRASCRHSLLIFNPKTNQRNGSRLYSTSAFQPLAGGMCAINLTVGGKNLVRLFKVSPPPSTVRILRVPELQQSQWNRNNENGIPTPRAVENNRQNTVISLLSGRSLPRVSPPCDDTRVLIIPSPCGYTSNLHGAMVTPPSPARSPAVEFHGCFCPRITIEFAVCRGISAALVRGGS